MVKRVSNFSNKNILSLSLRIIGTGSEVNQCTCPYEPEFEKSPSQTRVAKRIYKDNKRWYDNLDANPQPWYRQKIKWDKEMAILFCKTEAKFNLDKNINTEENKQ